VQEKDDPPPTPLAANPRVVGVLFWAWVCAGPLLGLSLAMSHTQVAWLGCPLCDAVTICTHRTWALVGLHALGALGLGAWWTIVRRRLDLSLGGLSDRRTWPLVVAAFTLLVLSGALIYEAAVEVESVMITGPVLAVLGCVLLAPRRPLPVRVVGASAVASTLLGFYVVVALDLSPGEARWPLFAIGVLGWCVMTLASGWALRAHKETLEEQS
jgi:hypothetical protein